MPHAGPDSALFYEDKGRGDAILFIPGFGGVGSFWNRQIRYFSDRFRVITIDQRGTGASARSRQTYSLDQMTDDARTVLDAAGVRSTIVVGHSTGGAIAQMLAAKMPDRVSRIVLSSTWCKPGNYFRRVFEFRRSLLELGEVDLFHKAGIFFRYPPEYAERHDQAFEAGGGPPDIEITISRINAILQSDMTSLIPDIRAPTLVVAARDDTLVPKYMSDEVARSIAGSKYVVLNEGGHFIPETRSDEYNAVLDDFLTGHSV
ncbi:alpha/beta hydrolase [Bradyrhizobium sp. dw_78]|uniref:alpha/beta fold hydrolase n=1 Tax=Bradyrhizobium sp. dw_78 TaxID=2719793 RepID=UPI001BD21318|nr:alpha/beta hydrolase [Bradyrhizobium sp. dw_78]